MRSEASRGQTYLKALTLACLPLVTVHDHVVFTVLVAGDSAVSAPHALLRDALHLYQHSSRRSHAHMAHIHTHIHTHIHIHTHTLMPISRLSVYIL